MAGLDPAIHDLSKTDVDARHKAGHDRVETGRITTMDQDRYDRGLKMRKQVLGEEYVNKALSNVDDFNRDFQRLLTEYCWGEWSDDTLKPRERSILNLGMIAALGKMEEFQTHVRGALTNGLTPNELRAVFQHILMYCGAPIAVDCFRHAKPVIEAHLKKK